jgi:hypothetical protein
MRTPRAALVLLAVLPLALVLLGPGARGQSAPAAGTAAPRPPAGHEDSARAQASADAFAERVVVREVEAVVELPETIHESRRKALGPKDFQVLEDGSLREVVKVAAVIAADPAPWHMVLYFDRVLADPATVFFTANTLAQRAAQLTSLGTVDVVVADPQPRVTLAGSREAAVVEQALTAVAAAAEHQRDQAARSGGEGRPAPGNAAAVLRQEDRLVALVTGRQIGGPRVLVLVADGFDTSTSGDGATSATQAVAEEPARTLAAYGWITIAAPMRRQQLGIEHREMSDIERMRQSQSNHDSPGSVVPPEILPQRAPNTKLKYDGMIDLFVEPTSASLNAMATATGGTVVGYPNQLSAALTSLTRRWHVFYLAPDPEDGRPRPVEVRLLPQGTVLRAPVWRRSSTPDEVADVRLRRYLDGAAGVRDSASLALTAATAAHDPRSLQVTVGAYGTPTPTPAGPYRLSLSYSGPNIATPVVQDRLLTSTDLTEKGWTATVSLDIPPGARRLGVEVEDLAHQLWGVTALDLPAPPGGR